MRFQLLQLSHSVTGWLFSRWNERAIFGMAELEGGDEVWRGDSDDLGGREMGTIRCVAELDMSLTIPSSPMPALHTC